jgi:ABC-type thiamine transport system substrate-binding protein
MKNRKTETLLLLTYSLSCLFATALLSGCAGQAARQVARIELAHVVSYEQELDKEIESESQFYAKTGENIEERVLLLTPEVAENVIIAKSNEAADSVIGLDRNTITDWDLMSFVASAVADYQSQRKLWKQTNEKIQIDLQAGLLPLEQSKVQLKEVRKRLEKLQSAPAITTKLEEVIQFGKATQKAYDELNKKEEGDKQ